MSFTKTLLTGTAFCALCAAPALAAPSIHLVGADTSMTAHVKTSAHPNCCNVITESITFSGTLSRAASFKVPIMLWGETWQDTATCIPPARERGFFKQKTTAAKINNGSSTGSTSACPSSTFTFYGPVYELTTTSHVQTDSFTGKVIARRYSGYDLTLIGNTNLTLTR